jgi:hypothetical protein
MDSPPLSSQGNAKLALIDHPSGAQHQHLVGSLSDSLVVGGADDDLIAVLCHPLQLCRDRLRVAPVKTGSWLVCEDDGRIEEERTSECYPLLLTTGEARGCPGSARHAELIQESNSSISYSWRSAELPEEDGQHDIVERIQFVDETEILEDQAAMTPPPLVPSGISEFAHNDARVADAPQRGLKNPGQAMQQCGLAGAGRAHDCGQAA